MQKDELALEQLWKSQEETEMDITTDEVCRLAHKREATAILSHRIFLLVVLLFCAAFVYNMVRLLHEPWLLAGCGVAIVALSLPAVKAAMDGPSRMRTGEPCIAFLRRELDGRCRGIRLIRWSILLMWPATILCSIGGGPMLRAKALGIHSAWALRLFEWPVTISVMTVLLAFCWFAFTSQLLKLEARKNQLPH
jgi:hypothetical protein